MSATLVREDRCPNCDTPVGHGACCFTHTEWQCFGCGARLDSRVVMPKTVWLRDGVVLTDEEVAALSFDDLIGAARP